MRENVLLMKTDTNLNKFVDAVKVKTNDNSQSKVPAPAINPIVKDHWKEIVAIVAIVGGIVWILFLAPSGIRLAIFLIALIILCALIYKWHFVSCVILIILMVMICYWNNKRGNDTKPPAKAVFFCLGAFSAE